MTLSIIDHHVSAYFRQILSTPPSDKVLNIFRKLHSSPFPQHKETVCCMSKLLIREFHVFPSYPVRDLMKMANFVGGFVEHGLISDENTLITVIGYIFYDLKNPASGNAFNLSYTALNRFKTQLNNFPNFCRRLRKIEDFNNFPPDLVECIEYGMDGLKPPTRQVTNKETLSQTSNKEEATDAQDMTTTVVVDVLSTSDSPAITARETYVTSTPKSSVINPVTVNVSSTPGLPMTTSTVADVLSISKLPVTTTMVARVSPTPKPQVTNPSTANVTFTPKPQVTTPVMVNLSSTPKPSMTTTTLAHVLSTSKPPVTSSMVADVTPNPKSPVTTTVTADVQFIVPSKIIQDKIRATVNGLSKVNIQIKAKEIKTLLTKKHLPWLAWYIIARRVRHEFNLHDLYSNLLDSLNSQALNSLILKETLKKIRILLARNKGIPSVSDKCLIKNLGHWLGLITLAKNQPIRKEDIDLEDLLAEAYQKGAEELLFVVQFVTKILELCSGGKFGPDNPWTTSIVNRLFVLYKKSNTKLQVKVEIEKLCKTLDIKLKVNS